MTIYVDERLSDDSIAQLMVYKALPAWRRWLWRKNLHR